MGNASAEATTRDGFLGGRIDLLQPKRGHRAGTDAVFLAAAVAADTQPRRVLDAGAGVGVAGLCLLARLAQAHITAHVTTHVTAHVTAVERDPLACELARRNAQDNGFSERFTLVEADLTSPTQELASRGLVRESYDCLIANPPFYAQAAVRPAPDSGRADAHVMAKGGLEAWIKFLATFAAAKATLTLIHRPEVLGELLPLLEPRFGDLVLFPLFPHRRSAATRIILRGRKGGKGALRLSPGLVLHQPDGSYTEAAEAVLRHAAPLDLEI